MDDVADLTARVAELPEDAQWALAWGVLKRFGYQTPEEQAAARAAWEVAARADIDAILALEKTNGSRPGDYRAAG